MKRKHLFCIDKYAELFFGILSNKKELNDMHLMGRFPGYQIIMSAGARTDLYVLLSRKNNALPAFYYPTGRADHSDIKAVFYKNGRVVKFTKFK